jgi:hypothetical protein
LGKFIQITKNYAKPPSGRKQYEKLLEKNKCGANIKIMPRKGLRGKN